MRTEPVPYRRMIFVCTNVRQDGRVACANPGRSGAEICERLKDTVKARGLKRKVRVTRSGCMDLCSQGPNVAVFPDNVWHAGVGVEDLPGIIEKYLAPLEDKSLSE